MLAKSNDNNDDDDDDDDDDNDHFIIIIILALQGVVSSKVNQHNFSFLLEPTD